MGTDTTAAAPPRRAPICALRADDVPRYLRRGVVGIEARDDRTVASTGYNRKQPTRPAMPRQGGKHQAISEEQIAAKGAG